MSISPNVPTPQESYHYDGTTTGTPRWIAVVFIVLFLALAGLGYARYSIQSRLDSTLSKAQDQNRLLAAQLDQANSRLADLKGHIDVSEQKMHMTQAELANARSRAESIRKDQLAEDQKLAEQLNTATKESNEKINAVASEVGGAKKDIEATRSDLEATKGRLERASGDMGVMSGLIAHNRDDLEELKRRGDRNYYEFKITRGRKSAPFRSLSTRPIRKSPSTPSRFLWTTAPSKRKTRLPASPCNSTCAAALACRRMNSWSSKSVRTRSPAISRLPRRPALLPPPLRPPSRPKEASASFSFRSPVLRSGNFAQLRASVFFPPTLAWLRCHLTACIPPERLMNLAFARRLAFPILIFALLGSSHTFAQAPLEPARLPARTSFYLIWRGTPPAETRKTNSLLGLWDDSDLAPLRAAIFQSTQSSSPKDSSAQPLTRDEIEQFSSLLENSFVLGYLRKSEANVAAVSARA